MAKHCDVCNRSYPETEARCPHCAAAERAAPGDTGSAVNLGDPHVAEVADSSGRLSGPPSPQSHSHVEWAALAEEVPDDAPKIDSPSDADLLANAPATPPPAAGEAAVGDEPFVAETASDVDLAGGPFVADVAEESTSAIDLAALAGQSATGSSLHGGAAAQPAGEAAPPEQGAMATEVEVGAAPPAARGADDGDTHFLDDVAEVEAGSAVNLGEAARPTDRPSSRDLIAEAVESGVDVAGARAAGEAATEPEAAAKASKPASHHATDPDAEESSSDRVDLGSHETAALTEGPAGPSSEVDLGGKAGRARKRPAASQPTSDVDLAGAAREEAAEQAEEEAAPARAEEEEERPAPKPPRARSGAGGALVGGAVGLLIGVGAAFGLWLFGVEPPAGWKLAETKGPANAVRQQPVGAQPGAGAPAAANPARDLQNGDFAKVVTDLAQGAEPTPEVLAQRGTARWMQYLQEQKTKNAALKADDEAVKQARTDLETAAQKDNAEALLALGNLQEWTGAPADAAKTYQDGLKRFGGNARWARVFQSQLNRLESASAAPADGGKPRAGANAAIEALVALLLAFQADQPAAEDDEAGFEFWAAVKSAQAGDYAAALKALEAARKAHDKQRFTRLRKAQNPLSDPTEEIFLRSAKEIEAYWSLQNYLMQQKLVAKGGDPQKAIEAAVQSAATLQAQMKKAADNLGTTPDKLGAAVDALVKEKEEASKKATALATDLAAAKKDADAAKKETKDLADKAALTGEQLKTAEGKLKSVGDQFEAADKTLNAVADKLAAANVKVEKKDVVQGVERLISVAQEKDPKGELTASRTEIKRLEGALGQRHTPKEMLDIWLSVLVDRAQKANAPKAIADAERAGDDPKASAETRGQALAVVGLARRNLGDYVAAGNLLHNSLRIGGEKGDWQPAVTKALKELTDPNAYYLPRARELYEEGKGKEALDVLTEMEKVLPNDIAAALPLRSLMHLELARKDGKLDAASPHVAEARKDAEKAAAAGSAEGHYALGLIAEQLGDPAGAQGSYAKALAAHADKDEAGLRYRISLARVLKLQASKQAGAQAYLPRRSVPVADGARQPMVALLLLVELSFQAAGPEQDEVMKLADEVLAAKDGPDTFLYKAQALALKGLWTPALQTYAAGLRGHVRRDYADTLAGLVAGHPALRRPSSLDQPNPLLAEAHYAAGLRAYFSGRFVEAQSAFAASIQADGQDARYFYFLGLTRLALGNREDANADFEEGARLERDNRPGRKVVSTALERVQGPARQVVNRFRP